jgi:hypothetical protein
MLIKKRWVKWTIIAVLLFLAILIGINIWINSFLPNTVRQKLSEIDPSVHIGFASMHTSLLSSSITFHQLQASFNPDSNHANRQHSLQFDELSLSGIDLFRLIFQKKLKVRVVIFDKGQISLDTVLLNKKGKSSPDKAPNPKLPFKEIMIGEFEFSHASISLNNGHIHEPFVSGDLKLFDIIIKDSTFHTAGMAFQANNLNYSIPSAYHRLFIKSIAADSRKQLLRMDSLQIIPSYAKLAFGEKVGHQADHIELRIPSIEFVKIDIMKLLDHELEATSITIKDPKASVYRDRRIPLKAESKPLPVIFLRNIPFDIKVDELRVGPALVIYEEFPKDGVASGTLRIERLQMAIKHFHNRAKSADDHLDLKVAGSLMGAGQINANIEMPLGKKGNYEVTGNFINLNLVSLNPSAENLGGFHIESGLLNQLSFQFSMDSIQAQGEIIGEYHNLIIDKLKSNQKDGKKIDKLKTFALKHFIIPKNKDKSMAIAKRTGKVSYKRDPNRFFSHYMLHALLSGVKSSFTLGFLLPG